MRGWMALAVTFQHARLDSFFYLQIACKGSSKVTEGQSYSVCVKLAFNHIIMEFFHIRTLKSAQSIAFVYIFHRSVQVFESNFGRSTFLMVCIVCYWIYVNWISQTWLFYSQWGWCRFVIKQHVGRTKKKAKMLQPLSKNCRINHVRISSCWIICSLAGFLSYPEMSLHMKFIKLKRDPKTFEYS